MRFSRSIIWVFAVFLAMPAGDAMADDGWEGTIGSQGRQIESLQKHVELLREREREERERVEELDDLREEVLRMEEWLERLQEELKATKAETRQVRADFDRYREEYRSWAQIHAVGEKLPELTTTSGKRYRDVTIKKVTDVGLVIWHKDGTTRVVFNDLSPGMRDRFQWDEQRAVAELRLEAEREVRQDEYLARVRRREAEQQREQAEKAGRAVLDRRVATLERQVRAQQAAVSRSSGLDSSGRLGATRPFGSGSIYRCYPSRYSSRYSGCSSRYRRRTVRYYPVRNFSWSTATSCWPTAGR